jgi:hypothetical protein
LARLDPASAGEAYILASLRQSPGAYDLPVIASRFGPDDRLTLTARSIVAYYTGRLGDRRHALELYKQVLDDCMRVLGPDDNATKDAAAWVVLLSLQLSDRSGVADLLDQARDGDQEAWIRLPRELRPLAQPGWEEQTN